MAYLARALASHLRRAMISHTGVADKRSAMALSQASPTDPIEGYTPISLHRLPKVMLGWRSVAKHHALLGQLRTDAGHAVGGDPDGGPPGWLAAARRWPVPPDL